MRASIPAARRRCRPALVFLTATTLFFATARGPACAQTSPAEAAPEDVALAVPRLPLGREPVALPRPLAPAAARQVRQALNAPGLPLDSLTDHLLDGHILAERFFTASSRPSASDLQAWLAAYADLPEAGSVHALLLTKLPRGAAAPPAPVLPAFGSVPSGDDIEVGDRWLVRDPDLDRAVREAAYDGDLRRAGQIVAARKLPGEYAALLQAEIARAAFSLGRDADALALGKSASEQVHGAVGLAAWVGGLAAWRLGRFEDARTLFDAAYRAPLASRGLHAGAAYWSARVSLVTSGHYGPWMQRAAREPRTFYGLLARRTLGQSIRPETPFETATLAEADVAAVAGTPRGRRALALLQVDLPARAAAELRLLFAETQDQPGFARSILLVARAAGLPDLARQIAETTQPIAVRFPPNGLRPAGGFQVDPALVYALARVESNFDPGAVSAAGARGLLQIMPGTADYVLAGSGRGRRLHDPAANLDLGQRYLLALTRLDHVGRDLIRVLASYNAGPGNLGRWLATMGSEEDPLLFMEALPGEETRAYVPRALAYTWLYAAQMGLPSPSLDALAAGVPPGVQVRPVATEQAAQRP